MVVSGPKPTLSLSDNRSTVSPLPRHRQNRQTLDLPDFIFRFFFQAEDGIRDHCVTGVQTCALPISNQYAYTSFGLWDRAAQHYRRAFEIQTPTPFIHWLRFAVVLAEIGDTEGCRKLAEQIGRASCRERVCI